MNNLVKSVLLIGALFSFASFANINDKVKQLASPMENIFDETMTSWKMHRIRVRTRLEFGIEIPLLSKFKIKPEIELYFDKK